MNNQPTNEQAQGLYRVAYCLTNIISPGWPFKSLELVRVDERTGNLYVIADVILTLRLNLLGDMSHEHI